MATTTTPATVGRRAGVLGGLTDRQLEHYPETGARTLYLAITVLATVTLYYELYVAGSVSTLILQKLHMSFTFFVVTLAVGNLVGAFGSLLAGVTDRLGRTNLVVAGLLVSGVLTAFVLPTATSRWPFTVESLAVGLVEGICLVATPALIRDFSPQTGRATAMGFWTSGPVLGSLVVAVVASHTIGAHPSPAFWVHEYKICGIAGLVVFVIALLGLKELSPGLRDQLMVSMKDRALVEARAKGLDIEASLRNPFRQLLTADIIVSAIGVSVFLLVYYTAVGFGLIYLTTVFGFSVKDGNGLGNWNWGFNVIAVIAVGLLSDRLRVRKPLMVIGGIGSAVMMVVYLQASHHPNAGYYHLAVLLAALSLCLGIAYTPWMASFTETVEARNPALTATGLAIWGWIIRVVIFVAYIILPHVVTTTSTLVTYGPTVQADAAGAPRYHEAPRYPAFAFATEHPDVVAFAQTHLPLIQFAQTHPQVIAEAQANATVLAEYQRFAPEIAVIQAHPALFTQLAADPTSTALQAQAVQAAGGGAQGIGVLTTIAAHQAQITDVVAHAAVLQSLAPYAAQLQQLQAHQAQLAQVQRYAPQLQALAAVPAPVTAYVGAHAPAVASAAATTASQWRTWYWICFGGMVAFVLCVPLLKGRWSPSAARRDEEAHEAAVQAELARLGA